MKTVQSKSNPESVHHSIVNHEKRSFFTGQTHSAESFFSPVGIQPKLKIGSPNDQYERQADRVAEAVVSSPAPNIQQQSLEEEETLQRKCAECEKEEGLQMKSDSGLGANTTPPGISQKIQNAGGGTQLPDSVNSEMSQKIGADFSNVNIHTGPKSSRLNQSLGARAFTHGNNIFFNSGEYNPESREGKRLLAHELSHVVQQQSAVNILQKQDNEEENVITLCGEAVFLPRDTFFRHVKDYGLGYRLEMTAEASINPLDRSELLLILSIDAFTALPIPSWDKIAISQIIKLGCIEEDGSCDLRVEDITGMNRAQEGAASLAIETAITDTGEDIAISGSLAGALGASGQGSVSGGGVEISFPDATWSRSFIIPTFRATCGVLIE